MLIKKPFEQFKDDLRAIPWENCFMQDEFNRGWDLFKHYLISTIDKHVPLKEKQVRVKASPWLTREIRQLMNSRDFHLRKFNQTKLDTHWVQYKNLRNTVTKKIRTAKANHVRNVLRETADNPTDFWKQIKKCYPSKNSVSPSKTFRINGSYTWKGFNPRKRLSLINPENHTFEFKEVTYQ